jgi:hypothetical protein
VSGREDDCRTGWVIERAIRPAQEVRGSGRFGHVARSRPFKQLSYTPEVQFNSTGGTNTVTINATGDYTVRLSGLGMNNGHITVSNGQGWLVDGGRCKVSSWLANGSALDVRVSCTTWSGAPTDIFLLLSYVR